MLNRRNFIKAGTFSFGAASFSPLFGGVAENNNNQPPHRFIFIRKSKNPRQGQRSRKSKIPIYQARALRQRNQYHRTDLGMTISVSATWGVRA